MKWTLNVSDIQESGQIVRRAAEMIEEFGWIQGSIGGRNIGMCARGAIYHSARAQTADWVMPAKRAEDAFTKFLVGIPADCHSYIVPTLPCWNDEPDRTAEEVLQWMHKFADEADPQRP